MTSRRSSKSLPECGCVPPLQEATGTSWSQRWERGGRLEADCWKRRWWCSRDEREWTCSEKIRGSTFRHKVTVTQPSADRGETNTTELKLEDPPRSWVLSSTSEVPSVPSMSVQSHVVTDEDKRCNNNHLKRNKQTKSDLQIATFV